jgi:hypothetical protein
VRRRRWSIAFGIDNANNDPYWNCIRIRGARTALNSVSTSDSTLKKDLP